MCNKSILCFLLMMLTFSEVSSKVYLVSVGISDYPGERSDLRLPVSDAKTMTWLFTKNGDVIYRQLLNDAATTSAIISAMDAVYGKAGEDDEVVLFFSGHGFQGGLASYDGKLKYSEVRQAMAKSKSKTKLIFADACFSGAIRTESYGNSSQSEELSAKQSDVLLFLSARNDEVSWERSDMKNGYFTMYLQMGLRGNADINRDRKITAKELFIYVSRNVSETSKGEQHPVMWGKFSDDMVIMEW